MNCEDVYTVALELTPIGQGCKNSHFRRFSRNFSIVFATFPGKSSGDKPLTDPPSILLMIRHILVTLLALFLLTDPAKAQELDAKVELNISALPEQERLLWATFKSDMEGYLNNHTWTTNFSGERISCTFQFNVIGSNGGDYNTQIFVSSTRPLYQNSEITTMARFFDDKVEFPYVRGQVFQHGMNYRPLESVIDFYVYVILGLDYDSYKLYEGTQYFQQAHQIAVVASAAQGRGWEKNFTSTGQYSRLAYIEDVLNANNRAYRELFWRYNYAVLDLQTTDPERAREELAVVLDSLVSLKRGSSFFGRSPFVRTFFEAKYPELTDLNRLFPDNLPGYFQKLVYLDPLHQNYYEEARARLR